jgi:pyruvate,water dikinase
MLDGAVHAMAIFETSDMTRNSAALEGSLVLGFASLPDDSVRLAGGKGASLSRLARAGFVVPPGFVVCSAAFRSFLDAHDGEAFIRDQMSALDTRDQATLDQVAATVRTFITTRALPPPVDASIRDAYIRMGPDMLVAVRSSAVSEDGEAASFAGQHETFLGVRESESVVRHVRTCWASFYSPRAMFYRSQKGSLADTRLAVVVQEMVLPEKSGVLFTVDPIHKHRGHMVIEAVPGLGEGIVSGLITPDHFVIDRATGSVIREQIAEQHIALRLDEVTGETREVEVPADEAAAPVLDPDDLGRLRDIGLRLEALFGAPQDVEWSIRGGELFLLQSRPITTL